MKDNPFRDVLGPEHGKSRRLQLIRNNAESLRVCSSQFREAPSIRSTYGVLGILKNNSDPTLVSHLSLSTLATLKIHMIH